MVSAPNESDDDGMEDEDDEELLGDDEGRSKLGDGMGAVGGSYIGVEGGGGGGGGTLAAAISCISLAEGISEATTVASILPTMVAPVGGVVITS